MALVPANEVSRIRDGVKRFADGFTPGQKAVTIGAAALVLLGIFVFMSFSSKPTFVPLFTNLKASDAASITTNLTSNKIPYELADNDQTILVPANDVDQERLAVSEAGLLPQSTDDLSILDKEGITASSLTQQADYLQGLQGELEQTIDAISGVESSQVNIAMPTNQTFSLASNNPTGASVLVTMNGGSTLSSSEVTAIVNLVGSSVPGLQSSQVTVADSAGDLLAGPGVSQSTGGADSPTSSYDNSIQSKVEAYLTPLVGASNADVQVNAILDFDQVTTQTNTILPSSTGQSVNFCTTTNTSNSNFNGTGDPPTDGSTGALPTSSGASTYTQSSDQNTCTTNTQSVTDTQAPGTVKSQTVAVLVNSKALPSGVSLAQLQQGVANAAGIQTGRGDQLSFTAVPFSTTSAAAAAKAAAAAEIASKQQSMSGMIRTAAIVLIILIVVFLMWRSARKARNEETGDLVPPEVLAALQKRAFGSDEPTIQIAPNALMEVKRNSDIAEINRFIDQQPDEVAKMIRGWMGGARGAGA